MNWDRDWLNWVPEDQSKVAVISADKTDKSQDGAVHAGQTSSFAPPPPKASAPHRLGCRLIPIVTASMENRIRVRDTPARVIRVLSLPDVQPRQLAQALLSVKKELREAGVLVRVRKTRVDHITLVDLMEWPPDRPEPVDPVETPPSEHPDISAAWQARVERLKNQGFDREEAEKLATGELPENLSEWPPLARYLVSELEREGIPLATRKVRIAWARSTGAQRPSHTHQETQ